MEEGFCGQQGVGVQLLQPCHHAVGRADNVLAELPVKTDPVRAAIKLNGCQM